MSEQVMQDAIRFGRWLSADQRRPFTEVFSDSLSGDLARFQVVRRLRKRYRQLPYSVLTELVDEALS